MKLLTTEIIEALPKIYSTDGTPLEEQIVICEFFDSLSHWRWFVFEGEYVDDKDDYLFFWMVHGFERELGYFNLRELQTVNSPFASKLLHNHFIFKMNYRDCCDKQFH